MTRRSAPPTHPVDQPFPGHYTLVAMTVVVAIFLPFLLAYQAPLE